MVSAGDPHRRRAHDVQWLVERLNLVLLLLVILMALFLVSGVLNCPFQHAPFPVGVGPYIGAPSA